MSETITKDGITVTVLDEDYEKVRFTPTRPLKGNRKRPFTMTHIPGCGHFKSLPNSPDFDNSEFRVITKTEKEKGRPTCKSCVYTVGLRRESGLRIDGTPTEVDGKKNSSPLWGIFKTLPSVK